MVANESRCEKVHEGQPFHTISEGVDVTFEAKKLQPPLVGTVVFYYFFFSFSANIMARTFKESPNKLMKPSASW